MRGKKAKALRAAAVAAGGGDNLYIGLRRKDNKKITGQIVLLDGSTRKIYKELKREYKSKA
jgi:hypothetical protein